MTNNLIMWIAFWVIIAVALFIDIVLMNRSHEDISIRKAFKMVSCWVGLAVGFGVAVFFLLGHVQAIEYATAYMVEYSLSIDNMFVFITIFAYFKIPQKHQLKVLLYGIMGAVVLRFLFIFVGITLISHFSWMVYVFGLILIWTAVKMFTPHDEKKGGFDNNIAFKFLKKHFRFSDDVTSGNFFIKQNGLVYITPIFAAIFVVEGSDVVFAVDSIPAVLSITRDTFIVYTSNIFAILGLRSLYFLLAGLVGKFEYLKYGVAAILLFVGAKMLISDYYHIPALISLSVIVAVLAITAAISVVVNNKRKNMEEK
jgi:tellurite resistance protein TerC